MFAQTPTSVLSPVSSVRTKSWSQGARVPSGRVPSNWEVGWNKCCGSSRTHMDVTRQRTDTHTRSGSAAVFRPQRSPSACEHAQAQMLKTGRTAIRFTLHTPREKSGGTCLLSPSSIQEAHRETLKETGGSGP